MTIVRSTVLILAALARPGFGFADAGDGAQDWRLASPVATSVPTAPPSSVLDARLPPAIPGEEVVRGGKKMNVWSTAGSPGGQAPAAAPENVIPPGVNVIVDQRQKGDGRK